MSISPITLGSETLLRMDELYPDFLRRNIVWFFLPFAFELAVHLELEPWCPGIDHQAYNSVPLNRALPFSSLGCCELMLTLTQRISQRPVPRADQPAPTPTWYQNKAHDWPPEGLYLTMVLPDSFDLTLVSSLLVTLDSPFLQSCYMF